MRRQFVISKTPQFIKKLLEKSLTMRAEAYQAQVKTRLLSQTLIQIENSRKILKSLNNTLVDEITIRRQAEEKILHMASHDSLTGLPNRALFHDRLQTAQKLAKRNGTKLAIVFIDLDGFKAINDSLGHKAGDVLLQEVGKRFQDVVRKSDTVARVGGDEFIILLNELSHHQDAELVAKKLLACVKNPINIETQQAYVGASIGIAIFPTHGEDTEKLIICADQAMYAVKKSGKNAYGFYSSEG